MDAEWVNSLLGDGLVLFKMPFHMSGFIDIRDHMELESMEMLLKIRDLRVKFAQDYHRNTRGKRMDFKNNAHLYSLYNSLARSIVLQGSVQSLKSEFAIIDTFAQSALGLSVFFVLPKYDAKSAFVQNRIDRCIQGVPEYKKFLKSGFFDNVTLKNFGQGVIKFVGSNVITDFREFPADCVHWATPILMSDGREKQICGVPVGGKVVGMLDRGSMVTDTVVSKARRGYQDVFRLTFDSFRELSCTLGEQLYTNAGWKYLYELLPRQCYEFEEDGSVSANRQFCGANVDGVHQKKIRQSIGNHKGRIFGLRRPTKVLTPNGEWTALRRIEYVGIEEVWDLKTQNTRTCVASGVVVHNCMFVDEYDECSQNNLKYAEDRLEASIFQFKRYLANPTTPDYGICSLFARSSAQEWNVECEHCGRMNELDWFKVVVQPVLDADGVPIGYELMDEDWREGRQLYPICPYCGLRFDRFYRGEWVAKNPDAVTEGFHLSRLQSRVSSLSELYVAFCDALGDALLMKHFYTSVLGIGYAGWGARLTKTLLKRCVRDYEFRDDGSVAHVAGDMSDGPCSMGIDVGKYFDVRISEVDEFGQRKAVFIGKVPDKSELINLGLRYNVECAVIDSMPEFKISEEFQNDVPFTVWMCKYGSDGTDRLTKRDKKQMMLTVDRTTVLDKCLSEIKTQRNILPRNFDKILNKEYLSEMTCSVRQAVLDNNGNKKFVWSKGKDHQRHCDVYDYLAARMVHVAATPLEVEVL